MLNSFVSLQNHALDTLSFYRERAFDPEGGFYQNFYDHGEPFATDEKHLVSSSRMAFNFFQGYLVYAEPWMLNWGEHGLKAIFTQHSRGQAKGFKWRLKKGQADDEVQYCYGYAFVILACAAAHRAGVDEASARLADTFALMEQQFWLAESNLYADELSADGQVLKPYRGQNANMHACEAMLYACQATDNCQFLSRAEQLAVTVVENLSDPQTGLIWEHYREDLSPDWDFNRNDPKNLYRPWGYQPGHQTEWAKLLLQLNRLAPDRRWVEHAERLFNTALNIAWDDQRGGIYYGFAPDGTICDDEKYFWVQAESMAAAALLAEATGNPRYWAWYGKLADYCWKHFVDRRYGGWYRVLSADNQKLSNRKSEAGAKCDYHNFNACLEVMRVLEALGKI
jgi:mannose/cellobiose epimerase-like protein (N-acyl-D-glucosamine 2-epimerase family)